MFVCLLRGRKHLMAEVLATWSIAAPCSTTGKAILAAKTTSECSLNFPQDILEEWGGTNKMRVRFASSLPYHALSSCSITMFLRVCVAQ